MFQILAEKHENNINRVTLGGNLIILLREAIKSPLQNWLPVLSFDLLVRRDNELFVLVFLEH